MRPATSSDVDQANMLEKCLRILQAFRGREQPMRLAELVERTGMPKSTVHRLTRVLIEHQLLRLDGYGYQPGIALFELASVVPAQQRLRQVALPFMQDLFVATKETVHLGVRDGLDVVYVEKIYGHAERPFPSRVGGRLPLTCTAVGKALLAYSPQAVVDEVVARPLRRLTDRSVTDADELLRQLAEIRNVGTAFEREEATAGQACVAAPVIVGGEVVAALSLSMPVADRDVRRLAPAVTLAALGLARRLGAA